MAAIKPQFEPREYVMRDGRAWRPLVKPLTRCIGIHLWDDTNRRSGYVLIDLETGGSFGVRISRQSDCQKVAESMQAVIDDFGLCASCTSALNSDHHRLGLRKICQSFHN